MSGNCLRHIRISQTMLSDHIRRVTCHNIKRSCPKNISSLFNISLYDLYIILQMIIPHTATGHLSTFLLNFKPGEMSSPGFCFQQDRDNSRSCAHVQRSFAFFYFRKAGKKNCIHSKTEFIRVLNDIIAILKIIYAFFFFYQLISHLIWNLLFYLPDFQVPLILCQKLSLFSFLV